MKKIYLFVTAILANLLFVIPAKAMCPLCTIAVIAGVGLSRYLGIDDTITGLWIGGLIVSMIMWTIDWLERKDIHIIARELIVTVAYYAMVVLPLYFSHIIGHPLNRLWGMDKLLIGIVIGSFFFYAAGTWYIYLKKKNNNHAYFPFQKVVMPVSPLVILSVLFYFLTKIH